jgi:hypothetical protein
VVNVISTLIAALLALQAAALEGDYLYRTLLIRAAPGELLETIDLYTERMNVWDAAGERAFIMRHTQGDQWDLLLLTTMGSFTEYYSIERIARRQEAADASGTTEAEFVSAVDERTAWREEVYVLGPAPHVVAEAFRSNAYYHVEMFIALPGKREALIEERRMENAYLAGIDRPQNLIFRRVAGAAWDSYTIGFYKDIKHYAASADIPSDRKEASAKAAGFEGADYIGSFLRTLIDWHHDTLCVSVGR